MAIQMMQTQSNRTGLFAQAVNTMNAAQANQRAQEQHKENMALAPLRRREAELRLNTAELTNNFKSAEFGEWEEQSANRKKRYENNAVISNNAVLLSGKNVEMVDLQLAAQETQNSFDILKAKWAETDRLFDLQMQQYGLNDAARNERRAIRNELHIKTTKNELDKFTSGAAVGLNERFNAISAMHPDVDDEDARMARAEAIRDWKRDWDTATGTLIASGHRETLEQSMEFNNLGAEMDKIIAGDDQYSKDISRIKKEVLTEEYNDLMVWYTEQQEEARILNEDPNLIASAGDTELDWSPENTRANMQSLLEREYAEVKRAVIPTDRSERLDFRNNQAETLEILELTMRALQENSVIRRVGGKDIRVPIDSLGESSDIRQSFGTYVFGQSEDASHAANELIKTLGIALNKNSKGLAVEPGGYRDIENSIFDISDLGLNAETVAGRDLKRKGSRSNYKIDKEYQERAYKYNLKAAAEGLPLLPVKDQRAPSFDPNNPAGI